ncbi:MAG: hypothetical protein MRZ09_01315 [Coprobacillus sp.]|nr:hypothetical protein [Coprobacillus sp.]
MKLKDFNVDNFYVAISNSKRSMLFFSAKSNPRNSLNVILKKKGFSKEDRKSFKVSKIMDLLGDYVKEQIKENIRECPYTDLELIECLIFSLYSEYFEYFTQLNVLNTDTMTWDILTNVQNMFINDAERLEKAIFGTIPKGWTY